MDTRRVTDEEVVWRGVGVHIAVPVYPIPFLAVHVLLDPDFHPPITALFKPKSPVARDVRNTVNAAIQETLEVSLVT